MVSGEKLIVGKTYFISGFFDSNMSVPDIETYIFIGKNLDEGDENSNENSWYFQSPDSYFEEGIVDLRENNTSDKILFMKDDILDMVYDLDGIIEFLEEIKENM